MGGKKSVKLKNRDSHTIMHEIAFPLLKIANTNKFQLLYQPSCISQTAGTKEFIEAQWFSTGAVPASGGVLTF